MLKHLQLFLVPSLLLVSGCSSTEPLEERIRELTWRLDASEKSSEQATVDKRLAEREVELAKKKNRVLKERLALAYDGLREVRAKLDEGLKDRLTELSESTPGEKLDISKYGGVVLKSGILFRPGRHELTKSGQQALKPLVTTLLQQKYDAYGIELSGHTDSDPIKHSKRRFRDNWDLAAMRANSVRRFLTSQGIPKERTFVTSFAFTRPVAAKDKSRNRRVEIRLHKKSAVLPASAPRK